ncbi:MAG TPA: helix-turn-helix domain-containing protein [Burkholderiales bacterium]|nr:Fis family transcriptional regulator [Pseudomonadota bacterium]HVC48916.1 helix-turn-helix domain-containing protein [Burkholderiales bacterium]
MNENDITICLRRMMQQYFNDLDGEKPSGLYEMVLSNIEKPLLEVVLHHAEGNQTIAAEYLGINRHTLSKKMKAHGLK